VLDKDWMEDMDFDNLKMVVVVVVVDQVDIQKMDSNFDMDLVVVDKDFVDNHYLLELMMMVEEVDFQFVEENTDDNRLHSEVDYLVDKVFVMIDHLDTVFVTIGHLDTVLIDSMVETLN
jgi:hypothetical protein